VRLNLTGLRVAGWEGVWFASGSCPKPKAGFLTLS
jgi:hypothetical protein